MPGGNGFDVLKALPGFNFEVIFVTAYDQYGIHAIKFSAIGYLLKPVVAEELVDAVRKVAERIQLKSSNEYLRNLLEMMSGGKASKEHRLALPASRETRFVRVADIVRCESSNSYTSFYLIKGEKITVSVPIPEYEEMLEGYGFIRCHQSHLINTAFVKSMVKEDGGYLLMEDGAQVPVSRLKKEAVKAALTNR